MEQYIRDKKHAALKPADGTSNLRLDILDIALRDPDYGAMASTSELVDQLKTFFFAGHDTTASTISWSYYFLSRNPSALARLRQELDDVFGPNTGPLEAAEQIIADNKMHTKLEYTLAVIRESLRLEPPAASAREPPGPNYHFKTRAGKSFFAPEGSMIYTTAWMLHRDADAWGPDALEFKPERFMSGNPIPRGYMPFSKRPRDCIGSTLAYLEVSHCLRGLIHFLQSKIILALTVRKFDFEPCKAFFRIYKGTVHTTSYCSGILIN